MLRPASGLQLLALLLLLSTSRSAIHNDATESVDTQPEPVPETREEPADEDSNQARNGGRRQTDAVRNGESKQLRMAHSQNIYCGVIVLSQ